VPALEIKLEYIGIQTKDNIYDRENTSGFLAKVGIKFIHRLERSNDHPLTGWYLKPELIYSQWSDTRMENLYGPYPYSYTTSEVRRTVNSAAFNLVIGRQILLGGAVTLDVFFGIGYGFQDHTDRSDLNYSIRFNPYAYSHLQVDAFVALAFSGGMLFGIAF